MSKKKTAYINKIKSYYKKNDFESILQKSKTSDIYKIQSKEVLYIIALSYDQTALKKDACTMKSMQNLAKKYTSIIIKKFPHWDKGYFVMGLILQHSNHPIRALKFYKKAQQKNPKNTSYYLSLGNGYRAIKNYKLAEYYYKKALKMNDIRHLASINLVSLYEEMKERKMITKYTKQSLELLKNKKDQFSKNQKKRMKNILKY